MSKYSRKWTEIIVEATQ